MKEKENPRGKVNVEPGQAVAVVEEDVVVAEASLVDSTDEVETEVQEPRAEEVIKREEIATKRTRGQTKVLHK